MKVMHTAIRCLAVTFLVAGLIAGVIALIHAVPDMTRVLFSPVSGVTYISPTAGEILLKATSAFLWPGELLVTAAVLWLLLEIAESLRPEENAPAKEKLPKPTSWWPNT